MRHCWGTIWISWGRGWRIGTSLTNTSLIGTYSRTSRAVCFIDIYTIFTLDNGSATITSPTSIWYLAIITTSCGTPTRNGGICAGSWRTGGWCGRTFGIVPISALCRLITPVVSETVAYPPAFVSAVPSASSSTIGGGRRVFLILFVVIIVIITPSTLSVKPPRALILLVRIIAFTVTYPLTSISTVSRRSCLRGLFGLI